MDERHGGQADANVAVGGERRPSRHGVKVSICNLKLKNVNWYLTPISQLLGTSGNRLIRLDRRLALRRLFLPTSAFEKRPLITHQT